MSNIFGRKVNHPALRLTLTLLCMAAPTIYAMAQDQTQGAPADGPQRPIKVSAGILAGNLERPAASPIYPPEAKAAHVQGTVVLHAIISKTGQVENLEVISGPEMLRDAAVNAVTQWTYHPYLLNGQPTEVQTTINVNFQFAPSPNPAPDTDEMTSAVQNAAAPQPQPRDASTEYDGGHLEKVGGSVSLPIVTATVPPGFSEEARKEKFAGRVLVGLIVGRDGLPQNVHVIRGVGHGLDEKAVQSVRQYKFKPAMKDGEPVAVALNVEVNFQIFDGPHSPGADGNPSAGVAASQAVPAVSAPRAIYTVSPEYTPEARQNKLEGVVLVHVIVDAYGLPQDVRVLRSLDSGLDQKAVDAVKQYKFQPAMLNGKPVPTVLNIAVNFKLL